MRPRATIIRRGKSYSVVIDRGKDPLTGKRRRDWYSGYETPEAAQRQRTKLLRELDTGTYIDPSKQTVAHYLREDWLPLRKPTSQRSARGHRGKVSLARPGRRCATSASTTSSPTSGRCRCRR